MWIAIILLTASGLWAQPTTGSGMVVTGATTAGDSTTIFVPGSDNITVLNGIYALLVQQSANWLSQMDSLEMGYINRVDSLETEIAGLLVDLDQIDGSCREALTAQEADFHATIAALDRELTHLGGLIDSLAVGWDETFTQALAIIQDRDSTIHALSVAQVVPDSTAQEQAP